jgi:hypothetical protein
LVRLESINRDRHNHADVVEDHRILNRGRLGEVLQHFPRKLTFIVKREHDVPFGVV